MKLAGIGLGDEIPHHAIIGGPVLPPPFRMCRQRRPRQARDDRQLGQKMRACRGAFADRTMDMTETIFDRHVLRAACLHIQFGSCEAGQKIGGSAGEKMGPVKFDRDRHGQCHFPPGGFHRLTLRYRAQEIAAQAQKCPHRSIDDTPACIHGRSAGVARRLKIEQRRQPVEGNEFRLFRDPHSPLSLHVGMTANRRNTCAGSSDITL